MRPEPAFQLETEDLRAACLQVLSDMADQEIAQALELRDQSTGKCGGAKGEQRVIVTHARPA